MRILKSRVLKLGVWMLPLVLASGVWALKRSHNFSFVPWDTPEYGRGIRDEITPNVIQIRMTLKCQLAHPTWWPDVRSERDPALQFVAATIEDSAAQIITADEVDYAQVYPGDSPEEADLWTLEHISLLRPRGNYDLSRGGSLKIRLKIPSRVKGAPPYWEDEATVSLAPTIMHVP